MITTLPQITANNGLFTDGDWIESKDQDPEGEVRIIQLADIGIGEFRNRSNRHMTHNRALELGCTFLRPGDILVARMPDPIGRACIIPNLNQKCVTAVDVCIIRVDESQIDREWLMWKINSPKFNNQIQGLQSGTTRKRISRKNLGKIEFEMPVLMIQIQQREKTTIRLQLSTEANSLITKTSQRLEILRSAIQKAACKGKLIPTEAEIARNEGRDYEPADQLLERILAERRTRFEAENPRKKYLQPVMPDTAGLPDLPEGWCWTNFEHLFFVVSNNRLQLKKRDYSNEGLFPVIDQGEGHIAGFTDDSNLLYQGVLPIIAFGDHTRRLKFIESQFVCGGDGLKLIGMYPELDSMYCFIMLVNTQLPNKGYSRHFQYLKKSFFPIPPLAEQQRIVVCMDKVEDYLVQTEKLITDLDSNLDVLKTSILNDAYSTLLTGKKVAIIDG